jgi:hypothetical protein
LVASLDLDRALNVEPYLTFLARETASLASA